MAGEWWINNINQNTLKGVEGDDLNPIILKDEYIVRFLRAIPEARASYQRLYPTLLPAEQERLKPLADYAFANLLTDPSTESDEFQSEWNKAGIYTTGPEGGGRGW